MVQSLPPAPTAADPSPVRSSRARPWILLALGSALLGVVATFYPLTEFPGFTLFHSTDTQVNVAIALNAWAGPIVVAALAVVGLVRPRWGRLAAAGILAIGVRGLIGTLGIVLGTAADGSDLAIGFVLLTVAIVAAFAAGVMGLREPDAA